MSLETIIACIGSLGFPIVCCGALFYQQNKTMKEFSDRIEAALAELSANIQDNTTATVSLQTTVEVLSRIKEVV